MCKAHVFTFFIFIFLLLFYLNGTICPPSGTKVFGMHEIQIERRRMRKKCTQLCASIFSFLNYLVELMNFILFLCFVQVIMGDRASAERACKDPNPIIDGRKANVNLAILGAKPRGNLTTGKLSISSLWTVNSHPQIETKRNFPCAWVCLVHVACSCIMELSLYIPYDFRYSYLSRSQLIIIALAFEESSSSSSSS